MGYYNYPIARSYVTLGDAVGSILGDASKGTASEAGGAAAEAAKQKLLNDPAVDAKVKSLTQQAVDAGFDRAKQNIFGGLQGLMPYLPIVGVGLVAIVALMYFL